LRNRLGFIRLSNACRESDTNRVRSDANIAAMMSRDFGPPIMIGAPLGTEKTKDVGSLTGSEQLIKMSPKRTALVPITDTVFEPTIQTASSSGFTGGFGVTVSPG
jgi:hypothetical protein